MTTNNFDQSSSGTNLELSCFRDNNVSQFYFDENFHIIQYRSFRQSSILFYIDFGNIDPITKLSDCYDLSNITRKQARKFILDHFELSDKSDKNIIKDLIKDMFDYGTWNDFLITILDEDIGLYEACKNGLPDIDGSKRKIDCIDVTGYSQGDYSHVLYDIDSHYEGMYVDFKNLIFNTPVYCSLTVNDEEIDLMEDLDQYNYDVESILKNVPEEHKKWVSDNLPDYV